MHGGFDSAYPVPTNRGLAGCIVVWMEESPLLHNGDSSSWVCNSIFILEGGDFYVGSATSKWSGRSKNFTKSLRSSTWTLASKPFDQFAIQNCWDFVHPPQLAIGEKPGTAARISLMKVCDGDLLKRIPKRWRTWIHSYLNLKSQQLMEINHLHFNGWPMTYVAISIKNMYRQQLSPSMICPMFSIPTCARENLGSLRPNALLQWAAMPHQVKFCEAGIILPQSRTSPNVIFPAT